jgi:hypothetical protein
VDKVVVAGATAPVAQMPAPAALAAAGDCDGSVSGESTGGGGGTQILAHARLAGYSLSGTVEAVDTDASAISVLIRQSNHRARAYKGDVVTVTVIATTKLYQRTGDGRLVSVTLDDAFGTGGPITSVGALDKSDATAPVFTALRVTLRPATGTRTDCAD